VPADVTVKLLFMHFCDSNETRQMQQEKREGITSKSSD